MYVSVHTVESVWQCGHCVHGTMLGRRVSSVPSVEQGSVSRAPQSGARAVSDRGASCSSQLLPFHGHLAPRASLSVRTQDSGAGGTALHTDHRRVCAPPQPPHATRHAPPPARRRPRTCTQLTERPLSPLSRGVAQSYLARYAFYSNGAGVVPSTPFGAPRQPSTPAEASLITAPSPSPRAWRARRGGWSSPIRCRTRRPA